MEITSEKIDEGLACVRQTIVGLERVDLAELANDASFHAQYVEAMIAVLRTFTILEPAVLTGGQRAALSVLIDRYNRWAAGMTLDVLDHWAEQSRAPGVLN